MAVTLPGVILGSHSWSLRLISCVSSLHLCVETERSACWEMKLDGEAGRPPSADHTVSCQGVDAVSSTVALTFILPLYYLFISSLLLIFLPGKTNDYLSCNKDSACFLCTHFLLLSVGRQKPKPCETTCLSLRVTGMGQCCSLILSKHVCSGLIIKLNCDLPSL